MDNCMGIIDFNNIEENFGKLCKSRPMAMLPFGGRYRLADFFLSNMVDHDINNIGVFTGTKIRSVMDHMGSGKPWDLNRRFKGLFIFPPLFDEEKNGGYGDLQQFFNNDEFFARSTEDNIFLSNTNMLVKIDMERAYKHFKETDADVTLICKRVKDPNGKFINCEKIKKDDNGCVKSVGANLGTEEEFDLYVGSLFIKKEVYRQLVREAIEEGNARYLRDALLRGINKYKFNCFEHVGHIESIRNVKNYFDANMNLLEPEIYNEMFFKYGIVYTKNQDEPSTFYKENAVVKNSLIANGCTLDGSVQNSILFRGVKIGKNAIVKNSVIMQKTVIGENAVIVNAILDKYVTVEDGVEIIGNHTVPYVVEKDMVISKEAQR
ncbi:glucose-1-phosphate adenylyltransferase subunit GlgD [Alkalibacter rhizosphaerae]|uniref:Glucose-1-phosphate adenylyltransferase subunit GlgD n=1 Tax=Alkalibacter rhizosphaerae TaxID=2815577 RepID=A0A974XF22_9FIRM|nr:glucose-1-phosphate adenylyltransferase subunit GlgD [Alkalibacter rhizosphaerae]QSX08638.1 glucose-1-phosphate adenylyltransferase subunit GlgD [Alkalibacter rhizosphaerae]